MARLTIPITVAQLLDLARQLPAEDRRALVDGLLAERFDAVLSQADQRRGPLPTPTDEEIQTEVDAIRREQRRNGNGATGR